MSKMYVIQWKSKINGRVGRGTKLFEREEAEQLVEELNREYPDIHHESVEAVDTVAQGAPANPPAEAQPAPTQPEGESKPTPPTLSTHFRSSRPPPLGRSGQFRCFWTFPSPFPSSSTFGQLPGSEVSTGTPSRRLPS